jgi:hypothetical protein
MMVRDAIEPLKSGRPYIVERAIDETALEPGGLAVCCFATRLLSLHECRIPAKRLYGIARFYPGLVDQEGDGEILKQASSDESGLDEEMIGA